MSRSHQKRKRKPSITTLIRQARKAGERGSVRVEQIHPDGSRTIIISSSEPSVEAMTQDDAENLWQQRIAKYAAH